MYKWFTQDIIDSLCQSGWKQLDICYVHNFFYFQMALVCFLMLWYTSWTKATGRRKKQTNQTNQPNEHKILFPLIDHGYRGKPEFQDRN